MGKRGLYTATIITAFATLLYAAGPMVAWAGAVPGALCASCWNGDARRRLLVLFVGAWVGIAVHSAGLLVWYREWVYLNMPGLLIEGLLFACIPAFAVACLGEGIYRLVDRSRSSRHT